MSLIDELPPRAWTDVNVPSAPENVDWFDFYIEWLADYLFTIPIPLHTRQLEYASKMLDVDPESRIFEISDNYGYAIYELDGLENSYEAGEDWLDYDKRQRDYWDNDMDADNREVEESYEQWSTSKITWYRCREEWTESTQPIFKQGLLPAHADIPFRALLALAIKRIPERDKRIKSIRRFFMNFSENASK
jgi:hypothetical protein